MTLHYTSGGTAAEIATAGFNLVDVQTVEQLNALPAGTMGMVWLNEGDGVTASFLSKVQGFAGNPKLFGFFLVDEPDPTGVWKPRVSASSLMAESDWIHSNLPGAKTFITMMDMGSSRNPNFINTYNPANTHIDYFGIDPYPVRSEATSVDYNMIDRTVAAAVASGIPLSQIIPVFQAFGGGTYVDDMDGKYVLPTPAQLQAMMDRWQSLDASPAFDYAYAWGSQEGDTALENSPALQAVFLRHNLSAGTGDLDLTGDNLANSITGGIGNDTIHGLGGADILSGAAGNDMLMGGNGNDVIFGGDGTDTLNGEAGSDNLYGGLGADAHIGGDDAGIDYARYDDANYGNLTIRLDAPWLNTGAAAGDTYTGIEGLVGGLGNDTVVGNDLANYLFGDGGTDSIFGGAGADYLNGGAGSDYLYGGLGADAHVGGDDAGIDYACYNDANYGNLTIRLDAPWLNTGAAAGDTYTGIEGLVGGLGNDSVIGNGSANYLFGDGGADSIYGLAGADYLNGGAGGDFLYGGLGADVFVGGDDAGIDYVGYNDANYGNLIIRLDAPSLNTGAAAGDTYTGIEGLIGGDGNDMIVGDALTNYLFGCDGTDLIDAQGGNDFMYGGAGADQFRFSTALNALSNADYIGDFTHAVDDVLLSMSIFSVIGAALDASEFRLGAAAADANDYIIYDSASGQLYYDANGNAAGGQTLFATITPGTVLDIGDFVMV